MKTICDKRHFEIQNAAIDIGFFQVKSVSRRATSEFGANTLKDIFPSFAVAIDKQTAALVSLSSRSDTGVVVDLEGISYFVGEDSIRMFGSAGILRASNERYAQTPVYQALFLGALWRISKQHGADTTLTIKHLVLGLPLTTLVDQHAFVQNMATGTHTIPSPVYAGQTLEVTIEEVAVVPQPKGSIVSYSKGEGRSIVKPEDEILVLDLGGGTFDWFVCDGRFRPSFMLCGALPFGTLNCAAFILQSINPRLVSSPKSMKIIDRALRAGCGTFSLDGESYSIEDFSKEIDSLVVHVVDQMRTQVGELGVLDHILLTGGGARILQLACGVALRDCMRVMRVDPDPVFSNVNGFFQISEMMAC
jgi:plasmid segregation protein ParM